MRIKKIAKLCREENAVVLYNRADAEGEVRQWIGNGQAMWPVDGLPHLSMEHIAHIFELSDKQREEMRMREMDAPAHLPLSDTAVWDQMVTPEPVSLIMDGVTLLPVSVNGVMYFLQKKLLEPVAAEYSEYELWARDAGGQVCFAAKAGLMLVGLMLPYRANDAEFCSVLRKIAAQTTVAEV